MIEMIEINAETRFLTEARYKKLGFGKLNYSHPQSFDVRF